MEFRRGLRHDDGAGIAGLRAPGISISKTPGSQPRSTGRVRHHHHPQERGRTERARANSAMDGSHQFHPPSRRGCPAWEPYGVAKAPASRTSATSRSRLREWDCVTFFRFFLVEALGSSGAVAADAFCLRRQACRRRLLRCGRIDDEDCRGRAFADRVRLTGGGSRLIGEYDVERSFPVGEIARHQCEYRDGTDGRAQGDRDDRNAGNPAEGGAWADKTEFGMEVRLRRTGEIHAISSRQDDPTDTDCGDTDYWGTRADADRAASDSPL